MNEIHSKREECRSSFLKLALGSGLILLTILPDIASACATCFGAADSPMVRSMNAGILSLLVVILGVLGGIVGFIFHLRKQARTVTHD